MTVTWIPAEFFGCAWRLIFFLLVVPDIFGIVILWYYISNTPKEMLDKGRVKKEEYDLITSSVGAMFPNMESHIAARSTCVIANFIFSISSGSSC